ncbi:hypothetical protein A2U01_0115520, partial [Trifolium medium]|nr:hypothetical protein [Trifolium medium]
DERAAGQERLDKLHELDELRPGAYDNAIIYKRRPDAFMIRT